MKKLGTFLESLECSRGVRGSILDLRRRIWVSFGGQEAKRFDSLVPESIV